MKETTVKEIGAIVTPMPIEQQPSSMADYTANFQGYGLGMVIRDYRGHRILMHKGALPGYGSRVVLVPDAHLGIAVLTNQLSREAIDAIVNRLLDKYLGAPQFDWLGALIAARAEKDAKTAAATSVAASHRDPSSKPSLPLDRYAGRYRDRWYGDITIDLEGTQLTLKFAHTARLEGTLEHWQQDTFVVRWRDRSLDADAYITFALDPDGSVARATMRPISPSTDFSFDFQDLDLRPGR